MPQAHLPSHREQTSMLPKTILIMVWIGAVALLMSWLSGCSPQSERQEADKAPAPGEQRSLSVGDAVWSSCTTAVLRGLSEQLVAEVECLQPGTMTSIEGLPGVTLGAAVLPWLQTSAANSLANAAAADGAIHINSALRSLAQQYLLHRWYLNSRCGIGLAAPPGYSNHESGLAIDVDNYSDRRQALESRGFSWLGWGDPVHFDYTWGNTADLSGLSILAFQRLWNRNHPEDLIAEDGDYGPQTASRLSAAPANGFSLGASCTTPDPDPEPDPEPEPDPLSTDMTIAWDRASDGSYVFRVAAPAAVTGVEYRVDDYLIGAAMLANGTNFALSYTFNVERSERVLEVMGYDSNNQPVARGVALLDVTDDAGFFIRPMGAATYEIGVERASSAVAAIEVTVDDQWLLTDSVSGASHSTRLAVRSAFNQLGEREFTISTFNSDGTWRGTVRRTFEIR